MARKFKNYSLGRREKKLAGVCLKLGDMFAIDPTLLRVGFIAFGLFIGFQYAIISYVAIAIYFGAKRKQRRNRPEQLSEFERMDLSTRVRPSVHALRTELDPIDRRLMAIDAHIAKPNHELAREIEALREEK
jgi:phage shock protein PspC (stress-responsive transcriptional regulator)